ncbi:MAG TPA: homoserine dehydrogenase [Verrucomicrobiae bacterium]|jgi:homoserine dehydrogenase|nr:homoserine dehydrogenase [Verrucomicrobiae bacterium]
MEKIRIGLLGLGQVGGGVYSLLTRKKAYFEREVGVSFEIRKVAVRNLSKKRPVKIPKSLLTTNPLEVVEDPSVDVVVELIGGTTDAAKLIKKALQAGKHVVTANKALLAERGDEIFELAGKLNRWVFFEASVGGGIPIIKTLREGLVANRLESLHAIINGTCNYILSKMTSEKTDFAVALREAQQKGYAEPDPTLDVDGSDAAHKLAVLVRFGFGGRIRYKDIYKEGIRSISAEDIAFADEFGYRIKLLAIAKNGGKVVEARVQPSLLPKDHILANVNGSFNAILLHGDHVGDVLLYGRGAGSFPTASAVVSDLTDLARRFSSMNESDAFLMRANAQRLKVKSISQVLTRYYLRFHVLDRPGVLAMISKVLGSHGISISDCVQKERRHGGVVPLIMLTHGANEKDVRNAVRSIDRLKFVRGKSQVIRIEGDN